MKKARKKLTLHRETLATLADDGLNGAAGGAPTHNGTICFSICRTICCPTNQTMCITGCAGTCGTQTECIGTAAC